MALYFDVKGLSPQGGKDYVEHFPSEEDESGDPKYYGLLSAIGTWMIIEHNTTDGTFRYLAGKTSATYQTAWTNRAINVYGYLSEIYSN